MAEEETAAPVAAAPVAAAPAPAAPAPAAPVAAEPVAAEPAAAEPVAAEPAAAEPAAAEPAPAWPSAEEYGWNEWGGEADALPEQVREWYSKFGERWGTEKAGLMAKVEEANKTKEAWENMYNAVWDGSDDPRIAEGQKALESLQSEFAEYRQQMEDREAKFNAYVDKESTRYFEHIANKHSDLVKRLESTEGASEIVLDLSEGLDFEDALLIWDRGEEAVAFAKKAIEDGVGETYIKDLVDVKFPKVPEKESVEKRQPASAEIVTGAAPARRSVLPESPKEAPKSPSERRFLAAQRAIRAAQKK